MTPKQQLESKCRELEAEVAKARIASKAADERAIGFQEAIALLGKDESSSYLRNKLEDKVRKEKKTAEEQISKLEAKLSAFVDTLKLMEKDNGEASTPDLRPNSDVFKIREILRNSGRALNLSEILLLLGKPDTTENKNNVRGSVGRYAREGRIFVQTAPNTYGLVELGHKTGEEPTADA